ncbi:MULTISPECIES: AMP-binding protein [unclassified Ensifer]|uniref:AMP-binding protein n=1 Tax=unclassified Ensifer TaxID=2633371 RepID=UPI0008133638|nr:MULTISPECIES: AMP-binding protein [unclassified Ensifer]OCP01385.1 AMP-dependent synthetase [Ensifer sp. LC14]OCP03276.1 AMP-dependent synthetase [Ensifer sp. LC11]OCP03647.1 AMP-dependent synthetase [Ensifer sp. LC13]OCP34060.1 AMP-dependent synthetase [Ensifer sp. LC499]
MSLSFIGNLANWGDRPALVFPGQRIVTYRELSERVARQALAFSGPRALVSIEAELCEHAIVAYLAALKAGHAVAMQAPRSGAIGSWVEAFAPDYAFRRIDARWRTEHLRQHGEVLHPELAMMLSTSGSTGCGKAVRLSKTNVSTNAASIACYLGLTADDRGCLILPLHYSYGLSVLNSHLAVGASLYVPGGSILDGGFLDGLAASGCTNLSGVPYSYELLEKVGFRERRFPNLRFMTVAGGRLGPDVIRLYNEQLRAQGGAFFAMYGQTEATARIAYVPPTTLAGNEDRIGVAIPGGSLVLENENGEPIDRDGVAGELVYRGPNVMMGYATTRDDLCRGTELTELRTGDLATRHPDGLFQIVGRMKRISKIAGLRIAHDVLEVALDRRGIAAAVVGDDASLHVFYCGGGDAEEVRRFLAQASGLTLAHLKATPLAEMPRLASGKIDYNALNMAARQAAASGAGDAGGIEELFAQVFYPMRVKRTDSFLSLGGDSLRFVQLSLGLEKVLGAAPDAWETLSIAQLSVQERQETTTRRIGTDLVIRALAILLVVLHHETLWPIPGGSAAMVVLAGFSLARFQMGPLLAGDGLAILRPLAQILVPYYLIVAAFALAWGEVPWASVFLVGNVGLATPEARQMVPYLYWFIEAYCQMMLVFVGLFAIPPLRRFVSARPFVAGMTLLVFALAARLALPLLWPIGNRQIFTLPWIFYLAVIGWCAAVAEEARQRLILLVAGTGAFLFFGLYEGVWIGTKIKYLLQIAVLAVLLYRPRIAIPRWVAELILPLSAAGFHIYILHRFVPELLILPLQSALPAAVFAVLSIVGGIALGMLAWRGQRAVLKKMAEWQQREVRPLRSLVIGALRFPLRPL